MGAQILFSSVQKPVWGGCFSRRRVFLPATVEATTHGKAMQANHSRFIVGALLLAAACAVRAQDLGAPILLVAAPGVQGAYERTVLVAIPTSGGHAGVILNRMKDVKLAAVLTANPRAAKV